MAGVVPLGEGHGGGKCEQEDEEIRRQGGVRGGGSTFGSTGWTGRKASDRESRSGAAEGQGEMRPDSQRYLQDEALLRVHTHGRFIGLVVHLSGTLHGLNFR